MEGLDLNSPIVAVIVGIVAGVALITLSHWAKGLSEPVAGIVRLQAGEVSFTEVFGMFVLGYGIGTLVNGPTSAAAGPPGPPGVVVGRFGGGFNPFARGGIPVGTGFAFAFLMFLYRIDIVGKLSNPQTHKSVTAIIGAEAEAVEDIPAGGHGQITFRDPGGTLVGVMASADVHVPRGTRVRIVGTRGLNPLVAPETPQA
jgi:membrane-bound ClpP family serine protease